MKFKFRKGDQVVVIAGNDKGARGEVLEVRRDQNRVVVDGVNLRWKTRRPTQQDPKGERFQEACSIHASNVAFADPESGAPRRRRPEQAAS